MSKLYLSLILHHHQPEGNFHHIIESAYEDCYLPFIEFLLKRTYMKVALHYSGPLFRWLIDKHPDFIDKLRLLLSRGQIELVSGAYGEAILSVWDEGNQVEQINKMNLLFRNLFGIKPSGFWIAERVWEPTLPSILIKGGIEYTILDDNHFQAAGIALDEAYSYFLTENKGDKLKIIPSSNKLRYLIPFALVERLMQYLRRAYDSNENRLLAMGDDGEKFGVWPGTKAWVYGEKWLDKFADEIGANFSWLELILPSDYLNNFSPAGRVYLPTMSYFELMEWSLPAVASMEYQRVFNFLRGQNSDSISLPYIRGGYWRNFFSKYDESNYMHKRLVWLYKVLCENGANIEASSKEKILDFICRAQCNDAFWHGIFSGLYAPHLRKAVWDNLLKAHIYLDSLLFLRDKDYYIVNEDINCDGYNETMYSSKEMIIVFNEKAGSISEISYKPKGLCLTSCLRRRLESYHLTIKNAVKEDADESVKTIHHIQRVKSKEIENYLIYDVYERDNFLLYLTNDSCEFNHYRGRKFTFNKEILEGAYRTIGEEYNSEYRVKYMKDDDLEQVSVVKEFILSDSKIRNSIIVKNRSDGIKRYRCIVELSLNLFISNDLACYFDFGDGEKKYLDWEGEIKCKEIKVIDTVNYLGMRISFLAGKEGSGRWWVFPIYTVSQSEGGYEKVYQGSSVALVEDIEVEGFSSARAYIELDFFDLR